MTSKPAPSESSYTALVVLMLVSASTWIAVGEVGGPHVPGQMVLPVLLSASAVLLRKKPSLCVLIIISGIALIDLRSRVTLLGDDSWLRIAASSEKTLWASSAGGHAILRAVVHHGLDAGLLAPTCGVITAGLLLWRAQSGVNRQMCARDVVLAVVVGTLPIFSRDFIEVTPFGFPLAVSALLLAEDSPDNRHPDVRMVLSLVCAGCAVFTHGVYLLVVVLLVLRAGRGTTGWPRLRRTAFACLIPASTVALLAGMTCIAGFRFVAGDSRGGGDGRILPADVLDPAHLKQTFMLIVAGSPLGLMRLWRAAGSQLTADDLISFGLSGGFLLLWNFDLGWGRDLDLVLAASVVHLGRLRRPEPLATGHGPKILLTRASEVVGLAAFATVASVTGWQVVS